MTYKYISDSDFWYCDILIAKKDDPIEINGVRLNNPLRGVILDNAINIILQIKPLCSYVSYS